MLDTRKITVHVEQELLNHAMEETGKGISETIREGLKRLERERAYKGLMALQGKIKFKYSAAELRGDE